MAKKNNPLFQALKARGSAPADASISMAMMQPKQMVTITAQDVPSLKDAKPGDPVTVYLTGTIHSMNRDGIAEVEVEKFTDSTQEENQEADQGNQEPPMVQTSINPVPGAV